MNKDGITEPITRNDGTPPIIPKANWPSAGNLAGYPKSIFAGTIEFKNISLRYKPDLPLILKGLNLTISPGKKVIPVLYSTSICRSVLSVVPVLENLLCSCLY